MKILDLLAGSSSEQRHILSWEEFSETFIGVGVSCWKGRISFQAEDHQAQPLCVDVTQQLPVAGQEVSLRASFSLSPPQNSSKKEGTLPPALSLGCPPALPRLLPSSSHPAAVPAALCVSAPRWRTEPRSVDTDSAQG